MTLPTLRNHLFDAPFTLAMSSGFFGFYAHAGLLAALVENELVPRRVVGSSAGALIGGCYAAGMSPAEIEELLNGLTRDDFWDPGPGLGLLKGQRMDALLRQALPVHDFDALSVPFACSAFSLRSRKTEVLEKGDLVHALRASAAFPGLFHPVQVDQKLYLDGGIADRPAFEPLAPGERTLYHHLSTPTPWRRSPGKTISSLPHTEIFVLDLGPFPRLGPFRLSEGARVFAMARERTLNALDQSGPGAAASPLP